MVTRIEEDWKPLSIEQVTVMVVDDDHLITRLVVGIMKTIGITQVYSMNDPHQALDLVAEGLGGIDLIVCDLMMPEVDGLAVLKEARAIKPDIPFLMLTADGTSDSVKHAVELGVTAYMVKPFTVEGLQSKVRQLIIRTYGPAAGVHGNRGDAEPESSWS